MGKTLAVAQIQLQKDIEDALYNALLESFPKVQDNTGNANKVSDKIARKFAQKGAPAFAKAIYNFVKEANITGTLTGIVTAAGAMGPVSGTNIDTFTGTELSLI